MKKLKKVKLTADELKQLKGGSIKNKNTVDDCRCTYYDAPSVRNTNSISGCSCECVGY